MSRNELNSAARDLMSVRQMIEELQAEAEALTDKLKAAMVEQGTEIIQGDGWKATWKNVSSSRFDSKSFKADHADPLRPVQPPDHNHPLCTQRMKKAPIPTADQSKGIRAADNPGGGRCHYTPGLLPKSIGGSNFEYGFIGNYQPDL